MATEILLASSKTTATQKLKFKEFCSVILKSTVLKLQERSPLTSIFLFSWFQGIWWCNKADAISMFIKVIDKLYENKHLASKESNNAKLQYEEFINDVVSRYQESFLDFDMSNDCLDHFLGRSWTVPTSIKIYGKPYKFFLLCQTVKHILREGLTLTMRWWLKLLNLIHYVHYA